MATKKKKGGPSGRRSRTTARSGRASRGRSGTGRSRVAVAAVAGLRSEIDRTVADLHEQGDRLIMQLRGHREKLQAELDVVEAEIARWNGSVNGRAGTARGRRRGTRKRPRNAMNLVESLHRLLTGTTMSVTQMAEAVQKAGYRTTSPNFRTIVNQTLINNKRTFKRVARGRYTSKK